MRPVSPLECVARSWDLESGAPIALFQAPRQRHVYAQTLARHSTITLTLDRYTHMRSEDELRAIEALPNLSSTEETPAVSQDSTPASTLARISDLWPRLTSDAQGAILVIAETCAKG